MSCLNDVLCGKRILIGIRDYKDCEESESGLQINDLPGMTLRNAASIASEEYASGADLFKRKINLATRLVIQDFGNTISGNFDFNAVIANRELNFFKDTEILPKENKLRGLLLRRWRSELAHIFVEDIWVQSKDSGIAIITIIDGQKTKNYEVSLQANTRMQFRVDYKAESEEIKILINDKDFQMYSGNIYNNTNLGCGSCSGGSSRDLYVTGWDGELEQNKYYGIGVSASIRCYPDAAICKLLPQMYFAIWYRAGIEICMEKISSNRINNFVSFSKEDAEKQVEYYWGFYNKVKKDFAMQSKTLLRSLTADCVTCNSMRHVQRTP